MTLLVARTGHCHEDDVSVIAITRTEVPEHATA